MIEDITHQRHWDAVGSGTYRCGRYVASRMPGQGAYRRWSLVSIPQMGNVYLATFTECRYIAAQDEVYQRAAWPVTPHDFVLRIIRDAAKTPVMPEFAAPLEAIASLVHFDFGVHQQFVKVWTVKRDGLLAELAADAWEVPDTLPILADAAADAGDERLEAAARYIWDLIRGIRACL